LERVHNVVSEKPAMASDLSKSALQSLGNYDLVEKIAEGGMGTVYKARERQGGQVVAIKLVSPQMASNPVFLQRFEKEYNAARSLDHPNVIRALDYGTAGGLPYLVMEYVEGESLGQRLGREGRLPEAEAIRLVGQVAQALQKAHKQGLIHRDVKPDNIMLTRDGQAKLADLGLVKELETDINLTRTGRGLGTPHFMAPEQFKNAKNADVRCDVYSLGATLYMLVTGKMPFQSSGPLDAWMKKMNNELIPPRKLNPDLSERLDAVILRAMNADPDQRPATCREFVDELTGQSTRQAASPAAGGAAQDLWYLMYKDEEGAPHMVKGTVTAIRRSLKENLLGDASNIRAGKTKVGAFEPLRSFREFRDLAGSLAAGAELATQSNSSSADVGAKKGRAKKTSPSAKQSGVVPHIPLEPKEAKRIDWVKMALLGLLLGAAMGAGVVLTILFKG
jgi:eukaryotic-like serine/threonine-protein kinase